jgi:hypothetical protein
MAWAETHVGEAGSAPFSLLAPAGDASHGSDFLRFGLLPSARCKFCCLVQFMAPLQSSPLQSSPLQFRPFTFSSLQSYLLQSSLLSNFHSQSWMLLCACSCSSIVQLARAPVNAIRVQPTRNIPTLSFCLFFFLAFLIGLTVPNC